MNGWMDVKWEKERGKVCYGGNIGNQLEVGGDVEEGQASQRVGRGMKGDENRVPWVKKLISRWK